MARLSGGVDRATSTTLGYALNLGISVLLIAGLVTAATGIVETQRQRTLETQYEVIGREVASALMATDRLAQTTEKRVSLTVQLPERVAGGGYAIRIEASSGNVSVVVFDPGGTHTVEIGIANETRVATGRVSGGPITISYEGSTLVVDDA